MNTNPYAKKILCYGDSNTWGANPKTRTRYPADKRWTGIAQQVLGNGYYIIEEGLNGRTTIYTDLENPQKNGEMYLEVCLHTHKPLDLVILMLGTNDVKTRYSVRDEDMGKGIDLLTNKTQHFLDADDVIQPPKVLIIAPPVIKEKAISDDPRMIDAPRKSKLFAATYQKVAKKYNCSFLDSSLFIESSDVDGYHLDEDAHEKLGKAIAEKIKKLL